MQAGCRSRTSPVRMLPLSPHVEGIRGVVGELDAGPYAAADGDDATVGEGAEFHHPVNGRVGRTAPSAWWASSAPSPACGGFLAGRPAAGPALSRAALLRPVGAAAGVGAVVAVARDPDYRSTPGAVTLTVSFVVIGVVLALGGARWWAVRTTAGRQDDARSTSPAA